MLNFSISEIRKYFKPVTFRRNILNNFLFVLSFLAAVFIPDFVIAKFCKIPIHIEWLFFFGILGFSLLLSYTNRIVFLAFLTVIFIMQVIQLHFVVYFGEAINAENIMNIVREYNDIFDLAYLKQVWFVLPLLLICYALPIWIFLQKKLCKIRMIWIILFYLAAHKPYRAYTESKGIWYFQPSITRPTLKNSISTFSYFFFQYYPKGYSRTNIEYQPYSVKKKISQTENILLVFGESLYANHLPMYGYGRNTFPKMKRRMADNLNYKKSLAVSSGIATATSTLLFFNVIREPANIGEIKSQTANLFKLAKEAGFNTYYFSNQESRLTMGIGTKYIDEIVANDTNPVLFARYKDEGLIELLKEVDFSKGKNFIVLHMRSPHLPYENRYKGREEEFEKFKPAAESRDRYEYSVNTYDNALLYTDYVIDKMIETFKLKAYESKNSIYVTADHGQLFNYQGLWGHNNLLIEQGKVPLFVEKNTKNILPPVISHYQIGKLIAEDLGFVIENPNEENNSYYLHGNNIDFPYDFIKYEINPEGKISELFKENTGNIAKGK